MKQYLTTFALLLAIGCNGEPPTKSRQTSDNAFTARTEAMPPRLAASVVTKETLTVGVETVVQSDSLMGRYQVVFEDDGDTGYFYALDTDKPENPIIDALHIYNVQSVTDRDKPSEMHIIWSGDGMKAALFINSYPHAVYNFSEGLGCCRTGFPPPADASATHDWDESQLAHFFADEDK
jgi:hypothetical protein|tara:strand:+ start:31734 stop:32270 length:537 start_codon:yes stop_codon:yes gene_type:complete